MNQITHIGLSILGYNRRQVDRLLEQKNDQVTDLQKQIDQLTRDLEQTRQDLVKYTEMEKALKDGIIDARMTGNKIVQESTEEAHRMVEKTNLQVSQYKEEFAEYSKELVNNGSHVKDQMKQMKAELLTILANYQAMLNETDFDALYPEKEVMRFNLQLEDYLADDGVSLLSPDQIEQVWKDKTLTEEEKMELRQLIQEVTDSQDEEADEEDGIEAQRVAGSDHQQKDAKLVQFKPNKKKKKK